LYKVQPRYTTVRFSEIAEVDVGFSPAWFILLCGFLPPWMSFGDAQIVLKSGEIVPIRYTIEFPGFYLFPLWLYPYHPIHGYSEYLHAIDYLRQRADSP